MNWISSSWVFVAVNHFQMHLSVAIHGQSVRLSITPYVCDVKATLSLVISFISCSFLGIISPKLSTKVDHFVLNEGQGG